MKRIVDLGFDKAIDAIKNEANVMYKWGVWNKYTLVDVDKAISSIKNSGYGADIYVDDNNMKYVSIPSSGDMW